MDPAQTGEDSLEPRENNDKEVGNAEATRKVLKADRERLRRDKLNEQFLELGNLLDPERPKNDKGTIITDTIQVLKDLNSEVQRLKAENALLCEESHELAQEKSEIREEKASLKSNVHDLKVQHHQQTQGFMVPWPTVDSQILMAQSYPFPVAVPMHQTIQPLPLFASRVPYPAPAMPRVDQSAVLSASTSCISGPRASSGGRSSNGQRSSRSENGSSNDVVTDLELKTPGSAAPEESSAREKRKQQEKPSKSSIDEV